MSDLKVLGVKVKQDVYDAFRSLDGNVSTNLRHAVLYYLKHNKEIGLTTVNEETKVNEYRHLVIELKSFEKDITAFEQRLFENKEKHDPLLYYYTLKSVYFQLKTLDLLESFIQIQLKDIDVDQQRTPGNKDKNDIWEEG